MSGRGVLEAIAATQVWIGLAAFSQVIISAACYLGDANAKATDTYALPVSLGACLFYFGYRRARWSAASLLAYGAAVAFSLWFAASALDDGIFAVVPGALAAIAYAVGRVAYGTTAWFGYGKPVLLAGVWTYFTAGYLAFELEVDGTLYVVSRYCFFLALALAFDYRDLSRDASRGLYTLTHRLGGRRARRIALALLALATGLPWLDDSLVQVPGVLALTVSAACSTPVLLWAFRQNRPPVWAYELAVDGLLILPLPIYLTLVALA